MSNNPAAVVTGSNSGLGAEIRKQLAALGWDVIPYDIARAEDVAAPKRWLRDLPKVDALVNCAGINGLAWLDTMSDELWDDIMNTNAKGLWKMTQALLPQLKASQGCVLNIVSNAAHMPMRCSTAYCASKAAALMVTKVMARELTASGVTVFSVSPNKLSGTHMSDVIDEQVMETRGWTKEQAQKYQLAGLLTGKETPVKDCAAFCAGLVHDQELHRPLAGCDLPFGL